LPDAVDSDRGNGLPDLTRAAAYRHWITDRIRYCDTDMAGHVNNVAFAAYAETGRLDLMHGVIRPRMPAGLRFIAASITVNYIRETHYPGELRIGTGVARIGRTSITVGQGIFKDDLCVATALGTVVLLEGSTPTPLNDHLRGICTEMLLS